MMIVVVRTAGTENSPGLGSAILWVNSSRFLASTIVWRGKAYLWTNWRPCSVIVWRGKAYLLTNWRPCSVIVWRGKAYLWTNWRPCSVRSASSAATI